MTEVTNLTDLRNLPITTQTVYVKGYDILGDGGGGWFLWRDETIFKTGIYSNENYGTIIKSNVVANDVGSWIRQYDGYINILWFGALGFGNDYTLNFQSAIDYASLNSKLNPTLKGSTVFIPNGSYFISHITLKNSVTLLGESLENTIIYAMPGADEEYMFEMERGVVNINISNLNLSGQDTLRGAFLFRADGQITPPFHGGLMNSRISNINIYGFKGHGIYLSGGGENSNFLLPNQFNIFENVRIFNFSNEKNALKMDGEQGQITFLNCEFDGYRTEISPEIYKYKKGKNIHIENIRQYTSAVISFVNCTCQDADYGFLIEFAENITIDNCWFENLGVAIIVRSNFQDPPSINDNPCKSINIVNNRFANAAGFGSLNTPNNLKLGYCLGVSNSFVNVNNNYVTVSDPEGKYFNLKSSFISASHNEKGGISAQGNTFQVNKLGKTFGIMQLLTVTADILNCAGNKLVFVDGTTHPTINTIQSSINAGEYLAIRVEQGNVTIKNTDNIAFRTTSSTFSFTITNGEIATFVKVDNFVGSNYETYQLVSIMNILS